MKDKLPMLDFFTNGNGYTGSIGLKQYKIAADGVLSVFVWDGPYCYDYSAAHGQDIEEREFPLDEEGLAAAERWLGGFLE